MWHRLLPAAAFCLAVGAIASAQSGGVNSRAMPPDAATIGRLNLKTEWTVNLPIDGKKDPITTIQTLEDQLFVQTRTGRVVAIDAITGRVQWQAQLGNGGFTNTYPIATNSQYAFVSNVTSVYSFHRYTGVVEFAMDLAAPASAGMTADELSVYCVVGVPVGNSGAQRIAVYKLPRPIIIKETPKGIAMDPSGKPIRDPKQVNPVDNLITRYAPESEARSNQPESIATRSKAADAPSGGFSASRTPSFNSMPKVTPPYTIENYSISESINMVPSLRQPYRLRDDYQRNIQQTPSIGTIPPSVGAALALSDLRPKNIQPELRWEFGFTSRVLYPVALTPLRVWAITDGREILAINKIDRKVEASQIMDDPISAASGRAGAFLYVPLGSGYVMSVDGTSGTLGGGATITWRTAVGGICNRTPFVTEAMVYAQGDNSGVVCLDRKSGDILWSTDSTADRVIAANHEFLYVLNRQGRLLVFDAKRATDPAGKRSLPLAGIDLSEFNIPIANVASDRLFLAADNGLIVCLRDKSSKYARPVRICPEISINAKPQNSVNNAQPGKDNPPPMDPGQPKKEMDPGQPKKEQPKEKE
jgi:outer membrane protein assembly factor BamB